MTHSRLEAFYWGAIIALACSILVFLATGCAGTLNPKQQAARDLFECRVHALERFIPSAVLDTNELVRDATMGKLDPTLVLSNAGMDLPTIHEAASAWNACSPTPASPDAGTQAM